MATFIKAGFWETLCAKCTGYKGWLNLDKFVESKIPAPAYKVYTALLTQSGGDNWNSQSSGTFTIGVTYNIDVYIAGDDFSNIGGPPSAASGDWDGYWFTATGTTPLNYGNGTAIQWNTGTPTVNVLENTIGNIWFTYDGIGAYLANSDTLFTLNKTFSIIGTNSDGATSNLIGILSNYDNSTILITSGDAVNGIPYNDFLQNTPIEIRVYN